VLPDGCRDLIVRDVASSAPCWRVSPLFDRSQPIRIDCHSTTAGFRLQPGAQIRETQLLSYIQQLSCYPDQVSEILEEFVSVDPSVEEALACLAGGARSVAEVAANLGVSTRTLQRLLLRRTARAPGYWLQLARVRAAARALSAADSLAELAEAFGYADQPHMNRAFQRWFGLTPLQMQRSPALIAQLEGPGYG